MISATNLTMRYGGKILFQDAAIQFLPKCHYGLIGPNGSGKSTLLQILAGEITPEKGDIAIPTRHSIGSLKQDHFLYEHHPIRHVVLMGRPVLWKAMQRKEALIQLTTLTERECEEIANCEKTIEEQHGYTAQSEASILLEGLGIASRLHEEPMQILSGGYKLRVLLAQLLFSSPDTLLLDEPTNHLDIFSIRWLEQYLQSFPGMLILSSHDRQFLNNVCTHIVDLDYGTITTYKGNYDAFENAKNESLFLKTAILAKQDKRKEEMMDFVERFGAKNTKARQAQSRLKMVEKLEATMEEIVPSSRRFPNLNFDICRQSGAVVVKALSIAKQYGAKRVLHDVSFEIERGERIAFVGVNGIGKSTLLEILTQHLIADQGSFTWGFGTFYAYFPQDHSREVSGNLSLLDWIGQFDPLASREKLQQILAIALFSGDDVHKPTSVLSGGETARLILAKMMLMKHNVLIFDEPTNHLDMEATDALIQALENYPGTILFVSHNRYFVQKLASRIIEMTPEGIKNFKCSYAEFVEKRDHDLLDAVKGMRNPLDEKLNETNSQKDSKQNYLDQKKQQRQKEQLQRKAQAAEEKCYRLESELDVLNKKLCADGFYQNASKQEQEAILAKKHLLESELNAALNEWESSS